MLTSIGVNVEVGNNVICFECDILMLYLKSNVILFVTKI